MNGRYLKIVFIPLIALLYSGLLSGCYTVVMHQKNLVESGTDNSVSQAVRLSDPNSCASCHDVTSAWIARESSGSLFGPNSMWIEYYDSERPWWVSHAQEESYEQNETVELGDTGMRRNYGRRREALNNDNASSSITTTGNTSSGAFIPSFPASIPVSGGTVTTTVTADSNGSKSIDSTQTVPSEQQSTTTKSQQSKRSYGLRKDTKKK